MIGRSLGNYRILEKLGEGGMGQVYLARDTELERTVAVKILSPEVAGDGEHLERFRREVQALAAVNHPGIVTVYSVGQAADIQYFAMEHVEGRSLADCIPAEGYSLDALLRLALPLVEAVAAAHEAGVVHRDLKPDNVMVARGDAVKVLDFGLAKKVMHGPASSAERDLTRAGALLGTVSYMAPEQLRGGAIDERSDLFALGVILHQMASGRHPFDTGDIGRVMMSILHDRPRRVSELKPELGAALDPILERCLEKEPQARYPMAAALRDALAEVALASTARTRELPIGAGERRERRGRRRPDVWGLTRPRNRNFCGRDEELETLRRKLATPARGVPLAAIVGLGGIGKSELAAEFAYRFAGDYETVWWLPADEPAPLRARYAGLGREIGLKPRRDMERAVEEVREWLGRRQGWLLLFDNAEGPESISSFLPDEGLGHALVTSRNPAWRGLGEVLELSLWSDERAVAFIGRRTGDADVEAARRLNEALGGLPLALEHAAAYIETSGQSVASYVELLGGQRRRLLRRREGPSSSSVMTTWDLSFQRLAQDSPAAEQLLELCAFFAPEDVPMDLVSGAGELLPEPLRGTIEDELERDETVAVLLRYSLVSRHDDSLSVHRLVQAAIREALADRRSAWLERAVRILSATFPSGGLLDVGVWPRCARLLPHALSCLGRLDEEPPGAAAELLDSVGSYLQGRGQLREALSFLERALEIEERARGRDHPRVAIRSNDVGRAHVALGELQPALAHFERALAIEEEALGPDHPNVAKRLSNIGVVLNEMDRLAEARQVLERALEISERQLGPEHPDVAHRLFNLATTLALLARVATGEEREDLLERAGGCQERALAIYETAFGPDHLLIGKMACNIGSLHVDRAELAEARRWLERSLVIFEKSLGPDHPEAALSLKNLGEIHLAQGDVAGARARFDRALAIEQEAFGGRHREQGLTLEHLGLLALQEGAFEEARLCFERALRALESTVGDGHRDTVRVRGRLAKLTG